MPLVKSASGVDSCAKAAKDFLAKNKVQLIGVGGAGTLAGAAGFASRRRQRAKEEAIVNSIVERNMQKTAFLGALKAGLNAFGSGAKAGFKGMTNSLANAGYKGAANRLNSIGQWGMNAGKRVGGMLQTGWNKVKAFGAPAGKMAPGSVTPMN